MKTIAVFDPAGSDFTNRLCECLEQFGSVLHLSHERFQQLYGRPFNPESRTASWLTDLETAYRFLVLEAGQPGPWAMHCVRQADRVLTVGRAWLSPELNAGEKLIFDEKFAGATAPVELVLLHRESSRTFSGTAAWLSTREVLRHHHVRLQVEGDIRRVARILVGRALGLTLGGGGARAFAHIGIIRAIEEAGIPIDMICGVSMGSIIAGQYAMGWDWQQMIRTNRAVIADKKLNSDFTLPIMSLSSGRRLRRALKTFFGDTAIEDLWLNYFCSSCNLSTSELVVHRRGLLWSSINASNSIPGVLPAVVLDGHLLVDGGILNNQPGDLMKEACGGPVIVVSVSPRREVLVDHAFTEMPSPWRVLRSRLNPFEKAIRVPGIAATMMRALMVASNRKSREVESAAEFYMRPPIDRFRLENFDRLEEIAEVGYQYAREEIRKWKEGDRLNEVFHAR
jgi:predicted acylesterase/phospholipase RssA